MFLFAIYHLCFYFCSLSNTQVNNTFSLEQTPKTGNLDYNWILRQCKLDSMARFTQIESVNPNLQQSQIAKELSYSINTLQQYRNDINMLSPYRIPPNSHKRGQKIWSTNVYDNSKQEHYLKRPQMTSIDLKRPQLTSKESFAFIETVEPEKNMKIGGNFELKMNIQMKFSIIITFERI